MPSLRSIPLSLLAAATLLACHGTVGEAPIPERPEGAEARPAPRDEPTPAPVPAPPAVAKRLELCAVAPRTPAGLRVLHALRLEGEADTLAVLDGRRVPLAQAVGEVRVAHQTRWFAAKEPLTIVDGPRTLRYEIYDVGRVIEPGDLTYLGMADGLPLYAAAADLAAVKPELEKLLATEHDIARLLAQSAPLRARLHAIDVLYVPLTPTGCVFQAMLRKTP